MDGLMDVWMGIWVDWWADGRMNRRRTTQVCTVSVGGLWAGGWEDGTWLDDGEDGQAAWRLVALDRHVDRLCRAVMGSRNERILRSMLRKSRYILGFVCHSSGVGAGLLWTLGW